MSEAMFDPLRVVAGLRAHGVRYVLVGDLASMAHGSSVTAHRIEICVADDEDDVERLGLLLQALGAEQEDGSGDAHRACFQTAAGSVECLEVPREGRFTEMEARAIDVDLGSGVIARVAALEDVAEQRVASQDLVGAVRAATLVAAGRDRPETWAEDVDEFGPEDRETGPATPWRRVGRALNDVDRFLTDLNEGKLTRSRRRAKRDERP